MEIKIPKEIRDYTEAIFFGLSLRQFIFSALAVGVAVLLYFGLQKHLGTETVSWVCILGAAPFAALGFYTLPRHEGQSSLSRRGLSRSFSCRKSWFLRRRICTQKIF